MAEPSMPKTAMSHEEDKQSTCSGEQNITEESVKELCEEMNDLTRRMREIGRKLNRLRMDCALVTIEQATLCDPLTRDALSLALQGQVYFTFTPDLPEPSCGTPHEAQALPASTEPVAAVREDGGGTGEGLPESSQRSAEEGNPLDANGSNRDPGVAERRTSQPDTQRAASSLGHFGVDVTKPPPSRDPIRPDAVGGMYSVPPPSILPPKPYQRDSASHPFPPPPPPPPPGWNAEIYAIPRQTAIPPEVDLSKPPPRWPPRENPEGEGRGAVDESPN